MDTAPTPPLESAIAVATRPPPMARGRPLLGHLPDFIRNRGELLARL
jgi:hypothetical protein